MHGYLLLPHPVATNVENDFSLVRTLGDENPLLALLHALDHFFSDLRERIGFGGSLFIDTDVDREPFVWLFGWASIRLGMRAEKGTGRDENKSKG